MAMAPLMAGALLLERQAFFRRIPAIAPFAAACIVYFLFAYQSRATHLHFNDGTFSLATPFWIVVTKSIARIMWVWVFSHSRSSLFAVDGVGPPSYRLQPYG